MGEQEEGKCCGAAKADKITRVFYSLAEAAQHKIVHNLILQNNHIKKFCRHIITPYVHYHQTHVKLCVLYINSHFFSNRKKSITYSIQVKSVTLYGGCLQAMWPPLTSTTLLWDFHYAEHVFRLGWFFVSALLKLLCLQQQQIGRYQAGVYYLPHQRGISSASILQPSKIHVVNSGSNGKSIDLYN